MVQSERRKAPVQLKLKTAEFDTDVIIFHSGVFEQGEGMMVQVVDGKIGSDGKHSALYLDFGTTHGEIQRQFNTTSIKPYLGVPNMLNSHILPPTNYQDYRMIPRAPDVRELERRIKIRKNDPSTTQTSLSPSDFRRLSTLQNERISSQAIAISHSHSDHDGSLGASREDIVVIASEETKALQESMQELMKDNWFFEKVQFKEYKNGVDQKVFYNRPYIALSPGEEHKITGRGGIKIGVHATDHWTGSYAYEVTTGKGNRIFYTSDFRLGGKTNEMLWYLKNTPPVDMLILDSTHFGKMLGEPDEQLLEKQFASVFTKSGPTYVFGSEQDFTRLQTIISAAGEASREVYVPLSVAYYLNQLNTKLGTDHPDIPNVSDIKIYLQPGKDNKYVASNYPSPYKEIIEKYDGLCVPQTDLHYNALQSKKAVILFTKQQQLTLFDNDNLFKEGGSLINTTFGLNATDELDRSRLRSVQQVMKKAGLSQPMIRMNALHHADKHLLQQVINEYVNAKTVVVYPYQGDRTRDIVNFIEAHAKGKTKVITDLRRGEPITLSGQPLMSSVLRKAS